MTSSIIKKVLWLGATLALGLLIVQASPAEAASSCKSGYEKVKGKCVKKCKKGYGRRTGSTTCVQICKANQVRNPKGKCVTVLALQPSDCTDSNAAFCDEKEFCQDDQSWIKFKTCCWGYHWEGDETNGGCFPSNCATDSEILGTCSPE